MKASIVIPARYESTRFPGKPLVEVAGRTMIERVHRIAKAVKGISSIYVATDDERIREAAEGFGAEVIMTSPKARNGTERVAEAVGKMDDIPDVVINLQGDAPLTSPAFVEAMVLVMAQERRTQMATPAVRCDAEALARFQADRKMGLVGGTTVVCNTRGRAMYFSKEVIPYVPEGFTGTKIPVLHHVGLYAYRTDMLVKYRAWAPSPLEQLEGLEQLRVLEHGGEIRVVEVEAVHPFWEINNPEDVARIEAVLAEHGDPAGN